MKSEEMEADVTVLDSKLKIGAKKAPKFRRQHGWPVRRLLLRDS
jgi:hypothetical protein